ncbi:hypothetical protein LWI28_006564 [Acer negundo]|uniref:KIB1-4 beta-propeller domain-containing protein n=1 Tax=Acer negundo TaxID=4023 RepID=A0AAD5IY48_ACENE|nr:hypothetical protein LWI28_006564 [Acer negundo]
MTSSSLHAYRNNFLEMLLQNLRCKKKIKNNKQAIIENDTDHRRSWDDELVSCILGDIIVEQLNLFHCIHLSHISKSWRSAVIQRKKKIETAQVPWLVLSPDHHQPRVQLQLPHLRTIPSFKDFLREKKYDDYDITHFIEKIELSCSCEDNSNNFIVAASFYNQSTLALCRPGDKSWRIFKGSGADHRSILCEDILFYKGILYALINYDDNDADAAVVETHDHSMRIGDDDND